MRPCTTSTLHLQNIHCLSLHVRLYVCVCAWVIVLLDVAWQPNLWNWITQSRMGGGDNGCGIELIGVPIQKMRYIFLILLYLGNASIMCLTLRYCMSTKLTAVGVTWPWYRLTNALSRLLSTQADHYLWDCVNDNLWIWPLLTNKWVPWYGFILLPNLCKILFVSFFPTAKDEDKDCGKIFVSVQHSVVTYSQYQVTPSSSFPPSPSLPHLFPLSSYLPFLPSLLLSSPLFLPILLPLPRQATLLVEQ